MCERIGEFVERELSLALKPEPYINRCRWGMDFLGCRVYPSHVTLNRRSRVRFRRKLAGWNASMRRVGSTSIVAAARSRPWSPSRGPARRRVGAGGAGPYNRSRWTAKASNRVIRGGSWNNDPRNCRPANRNRNEPDNRNNNLGFPPGRSPAGAVDSAPDWTGRPPVQVETLSAWRTTIRTAPCW